MYRSGDGNGLLVIGKFGLFADSGLYLQVWLVYLHFLLVYLQVELTYFQILLLFLQFTYAFPISYLLIKVLQIQCSLSTPKKAPNQWHFFIIPRKTAGRRIPSTFPPILFYNIGQDLISHFPPDPLHNGRQDRGWSLYRTKKH